MTILGALAFALAWFAPGWLYHRRKQSCHRALVRMKSRANRNNEIATRGDIPEPPEVESLAVYAVGHEW